MGGKYGVLAEVTQALDRATAPVAVTVQKVAQSVQDSNGAAMSRNFGGWKARGTSAGPRPGG